METWLGNFPLEALRVIHEVHFHALADIFHGLPIHSIRHEFPEVLFEIVLGSRALLGAEFDPFLKPRRFLVCQDAVHFRQNHAMLQVESQVAEGDPVILALAKVRHELRA